MALPRVFSLSQREADIAIALTPPTAGRLRTRRVADYTLHLYATAEVIARHNLTHRTALRDVRFIGYIADMIFDKELDYVPLVGSDLRPQLTSTSLNIQLELDSRGSGRLHPARFRGPQTARAIASSTRRNRLYPQLSPDPARG